MATLKEKSIEGPERIQCFYDKEWFDSSDQGKIYLRYYSMPFEPKPDFYIPGLDGEALMYSGVPFKIVIADISKQTYHSDIPWLVNSESDNIKYHVEHIERILPDMRYILISTPLSEDDATYDNASILMDGFVGMLRSVVGNNLLRQLVRESAVDIFSRDMMTHTVGAPVPAEADGPFSTKETWQELEEISEAICSADNHTRARITLASQLVEKAFSSQGNFKFISYWIAIEVAASTDSSGKIVSLLTKAYGQKNNAYIQNDLGFQHLRATRTAIFHHGEPYDTPASVQRYMQCLFLDVARAKLGLDCRKYMAGLVEAGFDVNQLDRTAHLAMTLTVNTL